MINEFLKFLTLRKKQEKCGFCKKLFLSEHYKSRIFGFKLINVAEGYCSKKCEKAFDKALKKNYHHKKLTKQEKEAIKNLYFMDIKP